MRNCKAFDYIREIRDYAAEKGIQASFHLHIEKSHLMRIGNSSVSLNTSEHLYRLQIEVLKGKKTGNHTQMGAIESAEYVKRALDIAVEKAEFGFENNYQPLLKGPSENIEKCNQYDEALENLDSDYKVQFFKRIIEESGTQYSYSGSWSSGSVEIFMISTANKCEAWHLGTDQKLIMVLQHPVKRWELKKELSSWRLKDFKEEDVINHFKGLLPVYENNEGYKIEPGEYTVAFGAGAISELLFACTEIGFSGHAYEDKESWLCKNKIGDKIADKSITITDDPDSDLVFGMAFDDAGTKRRKFPLIEKGVFKGLMYSIQTAAKYNKPLTGHTLLYVNNVVLEKGNDNPDLLESLKGLGKVLYIPDIHYVGIPSPTKGILTGSSRYNAVLIEDGKIIAPLFSCRITERVGKIFKNIIRISSKSESYNMSNTYDRRSPFALGMPSYIVAKNVMMTDSADSF